MPGTAWRPVLTIDQPESTGWYHAHPHGDTGRQVYMGLAGMMSQFIKQEFTRTPLSKLAALVAMPVLNRFKSRVDHRRYSGGALLGLRGLVFKAHGASDAYAFERALARAYDAARNRLLDRVHDRIRNTLAVVPCGPTTVDSSPPGTVAQLAADSIADPFAAPPHQVA